MVGLDGVVGVVGVVGLVGLVWKKKLTVTPKRDKSLNKNNNFSTTRPALLVKSPTQRCNQENSSHNSPCVGGC